MSLVSAAGYCSRCVYPAQAVNTMLDDEGVCNACHVADEFDRVANADFWADRKKRFEQLVEEVRDRPNRQGSWDCIIPVSGGKDSYWQTHLMRTEYGLRPLLVTYHGNNYLPEGQANLDRMREVFGVDHMLFGPSIDTLRRINRAAFIRMGDMNWHAHAGIKIVPVILAVRLAIPLLVWGEITWTVSGMFSPQDAAEYNRRTVMEHDLRGFSPDDFEGFDGLEPGDLAWLRFPADEEIARVGVRGIYVGNYFPWRPNEHAPLMIDRYGFECAREPFQRTYRTMSNLDDMHENGVHDYMKFIKFGYGRASDHASKDVREGLIARDEAIELVRRYDHVRPTRDLARWLQYVRMEESEFDAIADTFRDPRVWWIDRERWWKHNVWGEPSEYGPVHLPDRSLHARYERAGAGSP